MARKRDDPAEALGALRALRDDPRPEAGLRAALGGWGPVVAGAAEIAGERALAALAPELCAALERLYADPVKRDPGCRGKAACAEALDRLDHPDRRVFERGLRFVQLEPAWGHPVDTASGLRARCALAVGRLGGPEALISLAPALIDPVDHVRSAAAQALAYAGEPTAAALLLLKLGVGDAEPGVVGDALGSLIALRPVLGIEQAERLLDGPHAEVATFALGRSRRPEALAILLGRHAVAFRAPERHVLITAIGLLRTDAARDWLLDQLRHAPVADARVAVRALGAVGQTPAMRASVVAAAAGRGLEDEVSEVFGEG